MPDEDLAHQQRVMASLNSVYQAAQEAFSRAMAAIANGDRETAKAEMQAHAGLVEQHRHLRDALGGRLH